MQLFLAKVLTWRIIICQVKRVYLKDLCLNFVLMGVFACNLMNFMQLHDCFVRRMVLRHKA